MLQKKKGIVMGLDALGAILAILILVAVVVPTGSYVINAAKTSNARAETSSIGAAISQYKYEIGVYPSSLDELTKKGKGDYQQYGPWLKSIRRDPWNKEYQYSYTDEGFVIYSFGENKTDDGTSVQNGIAQNDIGFLGK